MTIAPAPVSAMRPPLSRTLPGVVIERARLDGAAAAVIADARTTSYAELAERAHRVAAALRGLGVQRGDRVGVLLSNRIEWLEICLGAGAAGAVVVPVNTWSKPREIEFILHDAEVRTLFTMPRAGSEDFAAALRELVPEADSAPGWRSARLSALRDLVIVGGATPGAGWLDYDALLAAAPAKTRDDSRPEDDALILYTSGSTSKPKAVRLAHYGIIENGFNIGERQGLVTGDRVFAAVPLFWAYGSANALPATFTHGAALVLQERFEPGAALALIERHRCTAIYTLPGMTAALTGHPDFTPERTASLRTGLTIGNAQDVVNAATVLGAHAICNIYGSSETYGNCCVTPHDWPLERRAACQGPPLPGVELRLGDGGAIEVRGYLMRGYGGQSAVHNADVFTADGWYRTGDVGALTADGDIVFHGRTSEMIKRAGINISPAEVEDVLMQHASVAAAAVVGAPDAARGEAVVAFVVASPGVTAAELIAHCRATASTYKVPDRIEFRDALPATATGKLLRAPLKLEARNLCEAANAA